MKSDNKNTSMEFAYQQILQKIMAGDFVPGTPLREDHIASELGISSTPVREAFRRLEYEGWLRRHPFRGVALRKYTSKEIFDLYLLREALESTAAAAAAGNRTDEDLEQIRLCLEQEHEFICGHREQEPNADPDLKFHSAIAAATHNELLREKLDILKTQISCLYLLYLNQCQSDVRQNRERVHEEHWMIFMAIQRGWDSLAKALMEQHIAGARENHLKQFSDRQS